MASEESRAIQAALRARPASAGLTVEEWRAQAEAGREVWPPGLRSEPVSAGGVPAEWAWFDDVGDAVEPVVLVLHGGGFVLCSIATHRELGARVAAACGGRALVVEYRRAPEHAFPAAVEDGCDAYASLLDLGIDASRILLFGDSAGGTLALGTCLLARERHLPQPAGLILASPLTELATTAPSHRANHDKDPFAHLDDIDRFAELYLQGGDPLQPLASPLHADLRGLPPMIVLAGAEETLLDDSVRLAEAVPDAELHVIEGAFHTWLGYAGRLPEADDALDLVRQWAARVLAGEASPTVPARI